MTATDNERDLINGEIDGCNSEQESSRLRELIEKDPSVRDDLRGLEEVAGILGSLPPVEVPPDLKPLIMAAVREKRRQAARTAPHVGRFSGHRDRRAALRYVYAFAAGIAAGLIGGPVLLDYLGPFGPVTPRGAVGTLAPREATPGAEVIPLQAGDVAGTARFETTPAGYSVTLDLSTPGATVVAVLSGSAGTAIVGYRLDTGPAPDMTITGSSARWTQAGEMRLVLDFVSTDGARELTLEVTRGGQTFRRPLRPARS